MSKKKDTGAGRCTCGKMAWEHGDEPSGALAGAGSTPVLSGADKWKFLAETYENESRALFQRNIKLSKALFGMLAAYGYNPAMTCVYDACVVLNHPRPNPNDKEYANWEKCYCGVKKYGV